MACIHRRAALFGMAAATAVQVKAGPSRSTRLIDVHQHYSPPEFYEFNRKFLGLSAPPPPVWNKAAAFEDMERAGTELAILSGFTSPTGGTVEDRRKLARVTNDFGAALVKERPGRFALFATLPLPDIDGCLAELSYGLDRLGAVGVTVYADSGDRWLGDPAFEALHQELNRRGAVVFVHPHSPTCCQNLVRGVPDSFIEFGTTTTRTIASLIFNGVTTRYPRIKFLFAHGGGVMPMLVERFLGGGQAEILPGIVTSGQPVVPTKQPEGGALAHLRRLYYDTAQIANPVSLRALRQVVPVSNIMFGTDFWYRSAVESRSGIETSGVFSRMEETEVFRNNALRSLPGLAKFLSSES